MPPDPVPTAKPAPSTRQRVLEATLELFNERGAGVTTAEIAAAAGMREGNLHYYFRKKEDLVAALFDWFQDEELAVAEAPLDDPADSASYAAYQRGWFEFMWRFRCFYRDAVTLLAASPPLRARFTAVQERARAAVARTAVQAGENRLLTIPPERMDRFVANVWIVSSYWMDFLRANARVEALTFEHLQWGFGQIMALYEPYLTEAGRTAFRAYGMLPEP